MARYIDADECLDIMRDEMAGTGYQDRAMSVIRYAPTADVVSRKAFEQVRWERDTAIEQLKSYGVGLCEDKELKEVKHGEWLLFDECASEGVYCSVCYKKVYKTDYANQKLKSKYCPNCGAKMKGGECDGLYKL